MKHHYPPPEPFYRQQRTDLKKFDENYQAIDWSRKREPDPAATERAAQDTRSIEKETND